MTSPTPEAEAAHAAAKTKRPKGCQVAHPHCEECGARVTDTDDGYSPCCGEHVAYRAGCDGLHAEER